MTWHVIRHVAVADCVAFATWRWCGSPRN